MNKATTRAIALAPSAMLSALLVTACAPSSPDTPSDTATKVEQSPQDAFFAALSTHCGKAYSGELVSEDAADADFVGANMVMHVAKCTDDRIAVPFHVQLTNEAGEPEWDRSRTWVITRTKEGLRLKHDHRHKDGEEDALTQYGGDTADKGTATTQSFPVDQFSIDMFNAQGYEASVTNVWSVEVDPAATKDGVFAYQLRRTLEGGAQEPRLFRVEFDLNQEVAAPPPAWGWE